MGTTKTRTQLIRDTPVGKSFEFYTPACWAESNTKKMARKNGVTIKFETTDYSASCYRVTILSRQEAEAK